ncbi:hypothetical protein Pcinc_018892 [Petrolisthes cinctipes]|uniref:MADF domain-containing protein n=1 Tax=Petrolisthes cinctipes TaxID=88211 RepID=A0AAE1FMA1_PETCI|nr:hypothetical protein Pcinc_018892 [Petrolisthes cinctipes]
MPSDFGWTKEMLISLCVIVHEHKNLWDPRDERYMKTKLRQAAFRRVASTLRSLHPTFDLTGDQIRQKFKALKTYFVKEHRKVQNAPSGSEGKVEVKWELYPYLMFLSDTCTVSSQASWSMPSQTVRPSRKGTHGLCKLRRTRAQAARQTRAIDALLRLADSKVPKDPQEMMKHSLKHFVEASLVDIPYENVINYSVEVMQAIRDVRKKYISNSKPG